MFFFNDTATTEIYTLSLHDALPILPWRAPRLNRTDRRRRGSARRPVAPAQRDRKSTRLNSSHANISYAVFCLKKKKNMHIHLIENYTYAVISIIHLDIYVSHYATSS